MKSATPTARSVRPRRRLDPGARRSQLVDLALQLVRSRPFDQLSADDVARAAGVSKGLVFHYFPATADLHVAMVRAAADELVARIRPDPALAPADMLGAGLDAFIGYIEDHRASYAAIVRGAGSNPRLLAVFEETREAIVGIIIAALGAPETPPGLRIVVRGWIAMVEEATLSWLDGRPIPREELVEFLARTALRSMPDAMALAAGRAPGR